MTESTIAVFNRVNDMFQRALDYGYEWTGGDESDELQFISDGFNVAFRELSERIKEQNRQAIELFGIISVIQSDLENVSNKAYFAQKRDEVLKLFNLNESGVNDGN